MRPINRAQRLAPIGRPAPWPSGRTRACNLCSPCQCQYRRPCLQRPIAPQVRLSTGSGALQHERARASRMEHRLTRARHAAQHAAAAVRTLPGLRVCVQRGARAHGTAGARRGRPGWCRTPACGWCFLCSYPTAPPPAIAAANTSAAELNALLHRVGAVACQALVCRRRPGGVHVSSLRRGQA